MATRLRPVCPSPKPQRWADLRGRGLRGRGFGCERLRRGWCSLRRPLFGREAPSSQNPAQRGTPDRVTSRRGCLDSPTLLPAWCKVHPNRGHRWRLLATGPGRASAVRRQGLWARTVGISPRGPCGPRAQSETLPSGCTPFFDVA